MTGHRSVYPSQVLPLNKSLSLLVAQGDGGNRQGVEYQSRPISVIGMILIRRKKNTRQRIISKQQSR
jgi:hypothetical protein